VFLLFATDFVDLAYIVLFLPAEEIDLLLERDFTVLILSE